MKKRMTQSLLLLSIFIISLPVGSIGQTKTNGMEKENEKKYTIENCVNIFDSSKSQKTKVGYQYWFADKDFIDGRTLKMSVVAPHSATHPPHVHNEDEFFFVLEGTAEFYLDGKTKVA